MKGILAVVLFWVVIGLVILLMAYAPGIALIFCVVCIVGIVSFAVYDKYKWL